MVDSFDGSARETILFDISIANSDTENRRNTDDEVKGSHQYRRESYHAERMAHRTGQR